MSCFFPPIQKFFPPIVKSTINSPSRLFLQPLPHQSLNSFSCTLLGFLPLHSPLGAAEGTERVRVQDRCGALAAAGEGRGIAGPIG